MQVTPGNRPRHLACGSVPAALHSPRAVMLTASDRARCPADAPQVLEASYGLPGSPACCPAASDHFDCLGDVLEEEAKLLEDLAGCAACCRRSRRRRHPFTSAAAQPAC